MYFLNRSKTRVKDALHAHRERSTIQQSGCVVVVVTTVNSTQSAVCTKSSEGSSHFPVKFNQEKRWGEVPWELWAGHKITSTVSWQLPPKWRETVALYVARKIGSKLMLKLKRVRRSRARNFGAQNESVPRLKRRGQNMKDSSLFFPPLGRSGV